MVIIRFENGADWYKANWVYRQLADDVIARSPGDAELASLMEQAQSFGLLVLEDSKEGVASRAVEAMRLVAEETLRGTLPGWRNTNPDDPRGHRIYLDAMAELLALMPAGEP